MPRQKKEDKFYLGNKDLPNANMEFEWTPQMVKTLKKAKQNILYFAENFFYIVNLDRGKIKIELYSCQKRVLRSLRDNRFVACLASRQTGKTTMMTIYALWIACFQDDQRILIVANKEQTAINIFSRVRTAYEKLPNYLKPGVLEYGKTSMKLANGSSIGISTTSSDAGRGDSCNVLILDELAFIPNNLVDSFWKSVYPIISSSKKSKIFVASTPNGSNNLFYNLYTDADNGKSNWKAEKILWDEIPGRDEAWKQDTIRSIGSEEAFAQEFECKFLDTGDSFIDEVFYAKLSSETKDPEYLFDDGCYSVWEEPNKENLYTIGVDVAEGVQQNHSVIQVLDITDLQNIKQVAEYASNQINPFEFTTKVRDICYHWGTPPVLIERNNCGSQVVDNLYHQYNYRNIVNWSPKVGQVKFDRLGVYAHTNTKYKGITNMRYWVNELKCVQLKSKLAVEELKNFVRYPNGSWAAQPGYDADDRVMALTWALLILENSIVQRYYNVLDIDSNQRPAKLELGAYIDQKFSNFLQDYKYQDIDDSWSPPPVYFEDINIFGDGEVNDIELLEAEGWTRV
tara:strand:+ start:9358 stop:11064 length:1707 start_codon:yes stop_codon:yes gene_type:complete